MLSSVGSRTQRCPVRGCKPDPARNAPCPLLFVRRSGVITNKPARCVAPRRWARRQTWPTPSRPQRPAPRTPSAHRRRPQQLVSSVRLRLQPERVARSSAPSHLQPSQRAVCSAPRPRPAAASSELLPRRRVASSAPCQRRPPQGPVSSAGAGCLAQRRRPPRAGCLARRRRLQAGGCSARLPPRWAVGSSARPLLRSNSRRPRRRRLLRSIRRSSPSSCSRWRWPPPARAQA